METATKASDQQATKRRPCSPGCHRQQLRPGPAVGAEQGPAALHVLEWYPAHKAQADAHDQTADDFEQEGFFAVQHAAQTYDPAQGAFTTWLAAAMQRQIQRTLTNGHVRTVTGEDGKQHTTSADPLNHCTS